MADVVSEGKEFKVQEAVQNNTKNLEDVFRANERASASLEIMVCLPQLCQTVPTLCKPFPPRAKPFLNHAKPFPHRVKPFPHYATVPASCQTGPAPCQTVSALRR